MEEFVEIFHKNVELFRCTSRFIAIGTSFEAVLYNLGVKIPEHLDEQTVTKISYRLGFETSQGSWEELTDWVERKGHWIILGSLSMTGKPQVVVTLGYNAASILEDFGLLTSTVTTCVAPDWAPKISVARRDEDVKSGVRGKQVSQSLDLFKNFIKL